MINRLVDNIDVEKMALNHKLRDFFALYHCVDLMVEGNEVHRWTNITLKLFNFASDSKKTCRTFEQFVLCVGIMGGDVEMNYTVWYKGF